MTEPVTLVQAKVQIGLGTDASNWDDQINALIIAAREHVENSTGLILTPREVVQTADCFGSLLHLNAWPVRSITSVGYLDPTGVAQTVPPTGYSAALARRPVRMASAPPALWPQAYKVPGAVTVTMQAGYDDPAKVPQALKQAILLLVRHWFDNTSAVVAGGSGAAAMEVPLSVAALLDPHRMPIC